MIKCCKFFQRFTSREQTTAILVICSSGVLLLPITNILMVFRMKNFDKKKIEKIFSQNFDFFFFLLIELDELINNHKHLQQLILVFILKNCQQVFL